VPDAGMTNRLSRRIELAELRPSATYRDIHLACLQAERHGLCAAVVHPVHCERAVTHLRGSNIPVVAAVGFPTGAFTIEGKAAEARDAIARGASEIEYVVNVGALRSGNRALVAREMDAMRDATRGHVLKATLESSLLTDEEKSAACRLASDAGVDFVVTSTGFVETRPAVEDVRVLKEAAGVCVLAAGDIRTLEVARELLNAGASRLRTSNAILVAGERAEEDA